MMLTAARLRVRRQFAAIAAAAFAPPPRLTVSQWADRNRILTSDAGAAEPGPWRTSRVPYLREVMDCLGDRTINRVVVMKSSQTGFSECAHNWIGWGADLSPAPMLILYPTDTALKLWSVTRLEPLIRNTPALQKKIFHADGRRDRRDTMTRKTFPGGWLVAVSGKSSPQLRSLTAPRAIAEEVDELDADLRGQGDPLELLERAQRTFLAVGGKMLIISTPTIEDLSRVEREFKAGDQRHYYVPCPHCGTMQRLEWLDDQGRYRLVCDRGADGELLPATARYLCGECGVLVEERHKVSMLAKGEWRPTHPERRVRSFHINTLYSPFVPWATVVEKFLSVRKDPGGLKTFVNLWLGLPFQETGARVEPQSLQARAEPYPAEVPAGAGLLTGFVDVQGDRLELHVWGWGRLEESWVVRWELLEGDPGQGKVWEDLTAWLRRDWSHESGARLRLVAVTVDANYQTDVVHRFCEAWTGPPRVIPTIGKEGRGRPLITPPALAQKFKRGRARRAARAWLIGADSGKDIIDSRLRIAEPGPGYIHFPESLDPVFYDQLTAEKLVVKYINKRPIRVWQQIQGRRNEALDGAVGNLAALASLGGAVTRQLGDLVDRLNVAAGQPSASSPAATGRRTRSWGLQP